MTTLFTYIQNKDIAGFKRNMQKLLNENETADARDDALQQTDTNGNTLIHAAVLSGSIEILQLLMPWDLPLDAQNNDGKSALRLATEMYEKQNNEELAKIVALISTRTEWQNKAYGFRFNRVVSMLDDVLDAIAPKDVAPKAVDKVLLLGNTGCGKSTLINYLNGVKYKIVEKGLKKEAHVVSGEEIARTSHSYTSQTLFPQVIRLPGDDYVYCDLAGFEDNRGDEEQICAASSIHLLSKLPGNIKGILVVLDSPGFNSTRGAAFKDTAMALAKIINRDPSLMGSIRFMITKDNNTNGTSVNSIIEDNIKPLLKVLTSKSKSKTFAEDDHALKFMLEQIVANPASIMIPNIADNGASRKSIRDQVAAMPVNDPSMYNFLSHDSAQENFNDVLEELAKWYLFTMNQVEFDLPNLIEIQRKVQRELQVKIDALNKEIFDFEAQLKNPAVSSNATPDKTKYAEQIKTKTTGIATEEKNLEKLKQELKDLEIERATLDTDDMVFVSTRSDSFGHKPNPVVLDHKSIYALDRIHPRYSYYGANPSYTQQIPPMTGRQEIDPRDNVLCNIYEADQNQRDGKYKATFKSTEGIASYSVDFFTTKRDKFKAEIDKLDVKINACMASIAASEIKIGGLRNEAERLKQEQAQFEKDEIKMKGDRALAIERINANLAKRKEWLKSSQEQLKSCEAEVYKIGAMIKQLVEKLDVNADLFATVRRITDILDLNDNENIAAFWARYDADMARKSNSNTMLTQYANRVRVTKKHNQPTTDAVVPNTDRPKLVT